MGDQSAEGVTMRNINDAYRDRTSRADKVADRLAQFIGSWSFIIAFLIAVATYMVYNALGSKLPVFDAYPYIFLNLILAIIAAIQAPIILMAQNRQEKRDRIRNDIDFEITVRSEQEIQDIQRHLHRAEEDIQKIRQLLEEKRAERNQ